METSDNKTGSQIERRENKRYSIPAMVTCTFFEGGVKGKASFQGFIQDISLAGVSLEIRDDFLKISETLLLYTTVEMGVAFNFPDGVHHMDFSGVIRWHRRRKEKVKNFLYLGSSARADRGPPFSMHQQEVCSAILREVEQYPFDTPVLL